MLVLAGLFINRLFVHSVLLITSLRTHSDYSLPCLNIRCCIITVVVAAIKLVLSSRLRNIRPYTLAATLRGSRPGVQSASLIMTSLMTS